MARPRVFISSTYFDLRQVRADLDAFIREIGYDCVRNERGHIPYGNAQKLEEYCYREIPNCDILLAIIGGRFGAASQHEGGHSVTQMEIKVALELGKQVYLFIDKSVYHEHKTYVLNKTLKEARYHFAEPRIFEFITLLESLPHNNTIHPFESSEDIVSFLREQWAGLFQQFLSDSGREQERRQIENLQATARTLEELVRVLVEATKGNTEIVREVVLSSHPAMEQVRKLMGLKHRVFFTTKNELDDLLGAYRYTLYSDGTGDFDADPTIDWIRRYAQGSDKKMQTISIKASIFDEAGRLKPTDARDWQESNITRVVVDDDEEDDDVPF
jgi:hypothetical protein